MRLLPWKRHHSFWGGSLVNCLGRDFRREGIGGFLEQLPTDELRTILFLWCLPALKYLVSLSAELVLLASEPGYD